MSERRTEKWRQSRGSEAVFSINSALHELLDRWLHCKYSVLERSPEIYITIERLLRDPIANNTIVQVYFGIEAALSNPLKRGSQVSAALHIWGTLRGKAKNGDKLHFFYFLDAYKRGRVDIVPVKRVLYRLAKKQGKKELLDSRYFEGIECLEEEVITSEAPSSARR